MSLDRLPRADYNDSISIQMAVYTRDGFTPVKEIQKIILGDSRKYPNPTAGSIKVSTTPCPQKFQSVLPSTFQNF